MIAIIDYGAGNLRSVEKAFLKLGAEVVITSDIDVIRNAKGVVLPGVGAFGDCMKSIIERGLDVVIKEVIEANKPFLGICLGQQLLFESSEEGDAIGLGIFKGKVPKIPVGSTQINVDGEVTKLKVPHMGWNSLDVAKDSQLLKGIGTCAYVYFVHSYYVQAMNRDIVLATCDYGVTCDVVIGSGNVFATQFHPEKSGKTGLNILNNFIDIVERCG